MIETGKIKRLRILGGFLADLDLTFDDGLNCIIGARGTGKTTLLEALLFGFTRPTEILSPETARLLRENLKVHPIKIEFELDSNPDLTYTLTRYFDGETLCEADDRKLESVPNFPISVFSTDEIERIADDQDGTRKRKLLDGFEAERLRQRRKACDMLCGELKRNATEILVLEADVEPLRDVLRELPQLEQKLTGLTAATEQMSNEELKSEQSLFSLRRMEKRFADSIIENLNETHESLSNQIEAVNQTMNELSMATPESEVNKTLVDRMAAENSSALESALSGLSSVATDISRGLTKISDISAELSTAHAEQQIRYEKLREANMAISAKLKERDETRNALRRTRKMRFAWKRLLPTWHVYDRSALTCVVSSTPKERQFH
jgi:DNA repair exonuclease SbcCD ATPase subunit